MSRAEGEACELRKQTLADSCEELRSANNHAVRLESSKGLRLADSSTAASGKVCRQDGSIRLLLDSRPTDAAR